MEKGIPGLRDTQSGHCRLAEHMTIFYNGPKEPLFIPNKFLRMKFFSWYEILSFFIFLSAIGLFLAHVKSIFNT